MSKGIVKPAQILANLAAERSIGRLSAKLKDQMGPGGTPDAKMRLGFVDAFDPETWTVTALIGDNLTSIPNVAVLQGVQPMVEQAGMFIQVGGSTSTEYTLIGMLGQGSTGGGSVAIRKSADQNVTNTATLQLDSELKFWAQDQRAYLFEAVLFVRQNSTVATLDFAMGWTMPTGASWSGGGSGPEIGVTGQVDSQEVASGQFRGYTGQPGSARLAFGVEPANAAGVFDNRISTIKVSGSIKMGNSVSGLCTLSWCQNIAANASVQVREGSYLTVTSTPGIYP